MHSPSTQQSPQPIYCHSIFLWICCALCCLILSSVPSQAEKIQEATPLPPVTVYTEEFPPYSYTEDNAIKGLAPEIVFPMLRNAGITSTIRVVPWKRAINTVKRTPNTLLFMTAKSPDRIPHFIWVAPLVHYSTGLYRLQGRGKAIRTLEEAKDYLTATGRGYATTDRMLRMGFEEDKNLAITATYDQCVHMLLHGRVDYILGDDYLIAYQLKKLNARHIKLERLFTIPSHTGGYLTANPQTDPRIIERLQGAFAQMEKNGTVQRIRNKYRQLP